MVVALRNHLRGAAGTALRVDSGTEADAEGTDRCCPGDLAGPSPGARLLQASALASTLRQIFRLDVASMLAQCRFPLPAQEPFSRALVAVFNARDEDDPPGWPQIFSVDDLSMADTYKHKNDYNEPHNRVWCKSHRDGIWGQPLASLSPHPMVPNCPRGNAALRACWPRHIGAFCADLLAGACGHHRRRGPP